MFIMQSHCHHSPLPFIESLLKLSWNVMERLPTCPSPMSWSTNVAHWAVNGANVELPLTCSCMCWILTWLDKTHAFMVWDGFKAQGCMSCLHTLWDRPHFHQHSSCSLNVIIRHSHQQNLCWNTLEMSWNVFQLQAHHQCHYPLTHTLSIERGQCWNSFKLSLYVSKFDMVRLDTCLHGVGGFQDSRIHEVPT